MYERLVGYNQRVCRLIFSCGQDNQYRICCTSIHKSTVTGYWDKEKRQRSLLPSQLLRSIQNIYSCRGVAALRLVWPWSHHFQKNSGPQEKPRNKVKLLEHLISESNMHSLNWPSFSTWRNAASVLATKAGQSLIPLLVSLLQGVLPTRHPLGLSRTCP